MRAEWASMLLLTLIVVSVAILYWGWLGLVLTALRGPQKRRRKTARVLSTPA
jgi:hypothetical protein